MTMLLVKKEKTICLKCGKEFDKFSDAWDHSTNCNGGKK